MGAWKCPKCGREFTRVEQPHYCGKPTTVDEYIAAQEESVQPRLQALRAILRAAIPRRRSASPGRCRPTGRGRT